MKEFWIAQNKTCGCIVAAERIDKGHDDSDELSKTLYDWMSRGLQIVSIQADTITLTPCSHTPSDSRPS